MDQSCENVKRIRKDGGISLRQLAEESGLSISYLSNYENGKVNITVNSLHKIAKALNVSIKALLSTDEDATILVVPHDKRFSVVNTSEGRKSFVQDFLTRGATFDMQVTVVHLEPMSDNGSPDFHDGQEFIYIIEGSLELFFGNSTRCTLTVGDLAYYDAHFTHGWRNPNPETAVFLAVASKAGF